MLSTSEQEISEPDFQRVSQAVYNHCGINLTAAKKQLVSARLAKRVRQTGTGSYGAYLDKVLAAPESDEFTTFIDSLSTNLTSFFRENEHFVYLREKLLPKLIAERSGGKLIFRNAGVLFFAKNVRHFFQ